MNGISEKIPEFYYDLIARFIPGAIALAAFTTTPLDELGGLVGVALAIMSAYVIGFTIESVAHWIEELTWSNVCEKFHKQKKFIPLSVGRIWEIHNLARNSNEGPPKGGILLKMLAERAMFRSLSFISIYSFLKPPTRFELAHWEPLAIVSIFLLNAFYLNHRWTSSMATAHFKTK